MPPKRKYPYSPKKPSQSQAGTVGAAVFHDVRSITFHSEGDVAFQAALTFRDEEPMVSIKKLYFDPEQSVWKHTSKALFMRINVWEAFVGKVHEINAAFEPDFKNPPGGALKKDPRPPPPELGAASTSVSTS